jgi:hypothetical protein
MSQNGARPIVEREVQGGIGDIEPECFKAQFLRLERDVRGAKQAPRGVYNSDSG